MAPSLRRDKLAVMVAAGGFAATAPLFVSTLPSSPARAAGASTAEAARSHVAATTSASADATSTSLVGLAATGALVAAAASIGQSKAKSHRQAKVARCAEPSGKSPNFDPAKQLGAMEPLGFFDPAGFTKVGDEVGFRNLRAAEIKHGRVAMMAAVGAVVQHYVQFPGFTDVPTGLAAVSTAPGSYGFGALFVAAGLLELGAWTESPEKEPGNFGDPAGLNMYTEDMRLKELNNGRFAMFAAIGIIAAELYTGKDAIEQFGL